ncbi:hypothetical protein TNCV_808901 [Trichonephila clavipes]|nr:hypothetical protein TNCV_808901 [Trichonephila clavipes]
MEQNVLDTVRRNQSTCVRAVAAAIRGSRSVYPVLQRHSNNHLLTIIYPHHHGADVYHRRHQHHCEWRAMMIIDMRGIMLKGVVSYRVFKMEVHKEKIRIFLQFIFDKGKNASQVAEIANDVYDVDTATANYVQFCFRRFRSGILDVTLQRHARRRKCR